MMKVEGLKVTIFGGGIVALRKIRSLEGAEITVVSDHVDDEIKKIAKNIVNKKIENENDAIEYIKNSNFIIISLNDREMNKRLMKLCELENKIYNAVDDRESLTIFPSYYREGETIIAFSTSGRAPSLARFFRERAQLYSKSLDVIERIRKEIIHDEMKRREFFDYLFRDECFWSYIKNGEKEKAFSYSMELWRKHYETN